MQKSQLLDMFGSWARAAEALGVSRQCVHQFHARLPLRIAVQLHVEHGAPLDWESYRERGSLGGKKGRGTRQKDEAADAGAGDAVATPPGEQSSEGQAST